MTGDSWGHRPVLVDSVVAALMTRPDGVYVDGTVGTGGHAQAVLERLQGEGRILGIDRDEEALEISRGRLAHFGRMALFRHGSYEDLDGAAALLGVREADGILLDLGVSSLQLDRRERGFSFSGEAALDMRMDRRDEVTAETIVNEAPPGELEKIIGEFGEERFAARIVREIVRRRAGKEISTTEELAALVRRVVPRRPGGRIDPATRTFQALRIAVNRELERLGVFLQRVPPFLRPGGRLVILSYHSLEDRPVKRAFLEWERGSVMRRVTKKPVVAGEEERLLNRRARSVRMRVAERC